jgi:hypothetical protein
MEECRFTVVMSSNYSVFLGQGPAFDEWNTAEFPLDPISDHRESLKEARRSPNLGPGPQGPTKMCRITPPKLLSLNQDLKTKATESNPWLLIFVSPSP